MTAKSDFAVFANILQEQMQINFINSTRRAK